MKKLITSFLLVGLWLIGLHANALTTRFVMTTGICTTGTGCGVSWATASSDLQGMINASAPGDQVWVAAGTYKPTAWPLGCSGCLTIRDYTFYVKNGVEIYGGFAGTETNLNQRLISTNVTTLSGDIDNDNILNNGNAFHVVLASANNATSIGVVIDGFTITGGNADDGNYITVYGTTATIYRTKGGGVYINFGTNTLTNNTIFGNSAGGSGGYGGGGICTWHGTNTLENNALFNNSAGYSGGGIYTQYGTNFLTNNTLLNNFSGLDSGGISIFYGTNTLTNNTLSGNSAFVAGGIFTYYGTNTLINNTLSGNSAGGYGGGMIIEGGTNSLTNNTFSGNSAPYQGGIYTMGGGTNTFTNNILWGNLQGGSATVLGADYFNDVSVPSSNTFKFNILQNSYFANSTPPYGLGIAATGNLAQDPLFINATDIDGADNKHRTSDDGLHLQVGSPAIKNGDPFITTPTTDITGYLRTLDFDRGAYEWHCPAGNTLYVDQNIPNSGNGTSWASAFKSLDQALALAHCCPGVNTIKVAKGTYKPTKKPYNGCTEMTTTDPRDKTFHLPVGLKLEGGYLTYPSGGATRNYKVHVTTLSGDIDNNNTLDNGNAYHVVLASAPSGGAGVTIDGFEIKGGNANDVNYGFITFYGNAIYRFAGGGIYTLYGTNTLRNNTLSGNSALAGGGIFTGLGSTTLMNNTLSGNLAINGGGILNSFGTNTLTRNTLFGNSADVGGGIYAEFGTNILTNNVIANNSAVTAGGGIYTDDCTNTLTNNTLYGNSTNGDGGGICTLLGTNTLTNNIFWENKKAGINSTSGADYFESSSTGTTVQNNFFQLSNNSTNYPPSIVSAPPGNLFFPVNPDFFNPNVIAGSNGIHRTIDDGLRLEAGSPAINAGTTTGAPVTDILGYPRSVPPDMGAYERYCYSCPVIGTERSYSFNYNGYTIYLEEGTSPYQITWDITGNVTYSIDTTQYGTTITIFYDDNATWSCIISNINDGTEPDLIFSNIDIPSTDTPIVAISSFLIASQTVDMANGAIDITVINNCIDQEVSYLWTGPSDFTATTQDLWELESGWYVVEVTGCDGQQTTGVYWVPLQIRGRGKQAEKEQLTAYPNPFTQSATIAFTLPETTEAVLEVYGIDGREVAQLFKGTAEAGQLYTIQFDGAGLTSGIYIVSLTGATGVQERYRLVLTD